MNFWLFADFVVQNQQTIVAAASSSSISLTQPDISSPNRRRAIERKHDFDDLPGFRSRIRSTAGYILRSDVSRFYHSIYTHSISWALHTKPVAKANRGKHSLLGNELDCFLRDMQDGQTLGVPIGPDTSFLIAELILAKVDEIMVGRGATHAFRYIDDYEFAFPDRASAERALADLQEALNQYELALNPSKTSITKLPCPADSLVISELRSYQFRHSIRGQQWDLVRFIDRAFHLAGQAPDEAVLTYAIRKSGGENILQANWPLYQDFLIHCAINEPGSLERVIDQVGKYFLRGFQIATHGFTESVNLIIQRHAPLGHGSEVAWAIWAAIVFGWPLEGASAMAAASMADSVVALVLLDAHAKGLVPGFQFGAQLMPFMTSQDLRREMWLLAYEANVKNWLPSRGPDFVANDRYFSELKNANVFFYDENVTKPTDKSEPEEEIELVDEYF
ncbi:MAG: hypothetical protein DME60_14385 [Verrucomicrobia bacterium]|nr:MAG: hypothetical protein DME60_14385 [Verrucomicrobiota bacterium]